MGAAVRPLRRGASAWGARRRARGRVVAAATAPRDDDAEDAEVDDASRRERRTAVARERRSCPPARTAEREARRR
jgi:hypothetical protein